MESQNLIWNLKRFLGISITLILVFFNVSCEDASSTPTDGGGLKGENPANPNTPSSPYALTVIIPNTALIAGDCNALTLATTDYTGTAMAAPYLVVASLHGNSNGAYYSDANCQMPIVMATIDAGSKGTTIYYKNPGQEALLLTAYASGWAVVPSITGTMYSGVWNLSEGPTSNLSTLNFINSGKVYTMPSASPKSLILPAISLVGGQSHSCALLTDGTVWCWGTNTNGQLGNSTNSNSSSPVQTTALGQRATAIFAGQLHTCALLADGSVKCWGYNTNGELGDGTNVAKNSPTAINLGQPATSVSTGFYHTCALLADSSVKCWGLSSFSGQVGDGTKVNRNTPTATLNLGQAASAIAAGGSHTCALLADGSVKCWGDNSYGQLGNNTTTQSSSPTDTVNLGQLAMAIRTGSGHTCALLQDGTVKCWGLNTNGQLGIGSLANSTKPVSTYNLGAKAVRMTLGYRDSCAVLENNITKCWGSYLGKKIPSLLQPPSQNLSLSLAPGVNSILPSICYPISLNLTNSLPFNLPVAITDLDLSGTYYSDSLCQQPLSFSQTLVSSQLTGINTETKTTTLYYKTTTAVANAAPIEFTATSLMPGVGPATIELSAVGPAAVFVFVGNFYLSVNSCSAAIYLQTKDSLGFNSQSANADIIVNLSSDAASGTFYSDSSCSTPSTTVTVPAGGNTSRNFYYKDTLDNAGPTITASKSGMTSGTAQVTIGCGPSGCSGGN